MNNKPTIIILLSFLINSCSSLDEKRSESPYYNGDRFVNLDDDEDIASKSFFTVMKWKLFGPSDEPAVSENTNVPPIVSPLTKDQLFPDKDGVKISWIGHATAVIAFRRAESTKVVITDPIFFDVPFTDREVKLPIELDQLPQIDFAIISHNHFDHCDLETLKSLQELSPSITFVMPEGMTPWAKSNGLKNAKSLRWFSKLSSGSLKIHMMPAQHWSRRAAFDMMQNHWGSYVIEMDRQRVYFGGDTAYGSHFSLIREKFPAGFQAALLPIGAYSPRWFMKAAHVDPPEALLANRDLGSPLMLPIHWGTFPMADESISEPIAYLKESSKETDNIEYWVIGGQVQFDL